MFVKVLIILVSFTILGGLAARMGLETLARLTVGIADFKADEDGVADEGADCCCNFLRFVSLSLRCARMCALKAARSSHFRPQIVQVADSEGPDSSILEKNFLPFFVWFWKLSSFV